MTGQVRLPEQTAWGFKLQPALLRAALVSLAIFGSSAVPGLADGGTIVVMDASGSMWSQVAGRPKQEIAREALKSVLPGLPSDRRIGLMAYGHRMQDSCVDIELVVPPAAGKADQIAVAADGLRFLGRTPLTAAVRKAAEALDYERDSATIVLVTDGVESCEANPCALASELETRGRDITVHVVGLGLTSEEGAQVACLAQGTGGQYVRAGDAGELGLALQKAFTAEPVAATPQAFPSAGQATPPAFNLAPTLRMAASGPPLDGQAGQSWTLYRAGPDGARGGYVSTEYGDWKADVPPGDYLLIARIGRAEVTTPLKIEAGKPVQPSVVLDAGTLKIRPIGAPGEEPDPNAIVRFDYPGGRATGYGEASVVVPAGEQKITVRIGKAEVSQTLTLAAGQTIEKDVVVGVGQASLETFLVEGRKVENSSLFVEIFETRSPTDGRREPIAHQYGSGREHDLPPGDYVAVATLGGARAEVPFSVRAGERTGVKIVLNAGELTASAPGRTSIAVYEAEKDGSGDRKQVAHEFGETLRTALPAGDYVVVSEATDYRSREVSVTVRPGARVEIAVP